MTKKLKLAISNGGLRSIDHDLSTILPYGNLHRKEQKADSNERLWTIVHGPWSNAHST